ATSSLDGTNTGLFAGTNGGGVFVSTNDGASWSAVNNGLTHQDVRSFIYRPAEGRLPMRLFAGTSDGGVFLSTDKGANWAGINTGLANNNVNALAIVGADLFAGTDGGVWKRSIDEILSSVEEPVSNSATPAAFSVSQNFPNPFNAETVIRYGIPAPDRVTVEVCDIHGNRIAVLEDAFKNAGNHAVIWEGKDCRGQAAASGIVLCRIRAGEYQKTIRMLLLK
ncbi:MAG TPA: hypothetical protein VGB38_02115, partial [bacterium]